MKTVKIKGMSCGHCTSSVKEALEKLDGISDVNVNLDKGEAEYSGEVDQTRIKDAIESIGFEVL